MALVLIVLGQLSCPWTLLVCHLPFGLSDGEAPEAQMLRTLRQDVQSCEGEFQAASKAAGSQLDEAIQHGQNMAKYDSTVFRKTPAFCRDISLD